MKHKKNIVKQGWTSSLHTSNRK